jgi:hypothetical protein
MLSVLLLLLLLLLLVQVLLDPGLPHPAAPSTSTSAGRCRI